MEKNSKIISKIAVYSSLFEVGWRVSIPLVLFVVLGSFLDKKFASSPLFLFLGIFFSLFTSGYGIYKVYKGISKESKK